MRAVVPTHESAEVSTEKRSPTRHTPYALKKRHIRSKAKGDLPFRHKFKMTYKEMLAIPGMTDKLRFPPKTDRNLGPSKDTWCKFHKAFGHDVENCIALGYQLVGMVRDGFLKEYLEGGREGLKDETPAKDQGHEVPVHCEVNTISGGFSGGGCIASQRKKYAREVRAVEAREPDLYFTNADLRDVVPHDNDSVVISVVTLGRRVHRVLIDQGSSVDVMFWSTINKLQLSPDQLRPYNGYLFGFAGDQVEVRGHVELRTTFSYGTSSCTINSRYLVVNAFSAYNILLGRPALNRLGAVASTRHMKMKLPSFRGGIIVIKSNQKATKKCYENILKTKRGVCVVIAQS